MMESMIFYDATVNDEEVALSAHSVTGNTVRPETYGKARITHAMALTSTDDVAICRVIPSGYDDPNGFAVPYIQKYSATTGFDLAKAKLPVPIPVYNNSSITVYAQSETAADSVVFVWLAIEYESGGFQAIKTTGAMTQREIDAGAALTSVVAKEGTKITNLLAGKKYQIAGISGVGVDGQTAGIVGPCFVKFTGAKEFEGAEYWIPISNNPPYGGDGEVRLDKAGLKMPVFSAPVELTPVFLDYTAERPTGRVNLLVDSAGIK